MNRLACEQALALLMDYLKRELPPAMAASVQQHLDECRPCDRHARFESRFVLNLGDRLGRERCPERLKEKILDSLAREGGD
jgi:anti-sigma factor RsiW